MGPEEARILPDLAGRGAVKGMKLLLDSGVEVDARGLDGGTARHQAAWFWQPDAAELAVARGASLQVRGDEHDSTPLGWTAHGSRNSGGAKERGAEYARVASMLLEAGASIADPADPERDPLGRWLLCDASEPVAEVLRRHGARS